MKRLSIGWTIAAVVLLARFAPVASATTPVFVPGPFVEHVTPPALCRGRTNHIRLSGRELDGAVDLWTSTPGVKLTAKASGPSGSQSAEFDVEVPLDAPLGLYGLRVATRSGLSNVHLFLIDELPVQSRADLASANESQPLKVESRPEAQPLKVALPAAIHSVCRAATVDRYAIEVTSGQRVTFEVVGNRFGKDYDPLVTIRDAEGRILAECDNDAGLFFDCRFEHTFLAAGVYWVDVRDARFAGNSTWHYVLRMGDFPVARTAIPSSVTPGAPARLQLPQIPGAEIEAALPETAPLGWFYHEVRLSPQGVAAWLPLHADRRENQTELEPNDEREQATMATAPATLHGVLETAGDHDWFRLELTKGQTIAVRSEARALGSPADLELVLFNPDGREVRRADDVTVQEAPDTWLLDAAFEFSSQHDGPHFLGVREMARAGGPAYAYRIEVTEGEPKMDLIAKVARVTLPRRNYQPIPLKIARSRLAGPIELELRGAPTGVVLTPTTIPADVSEIVCRLQADGAAPLGPATVQIVGHWKSEDPKSELTAAAFAQTFPLLDRRVKDKDLRELALREDQLYPPPSLANQIALWITPAAPFDVRTPESPLLITKYVEAEFPLETTRADGFASPIVFTAQGGQIGDEAEERSNVFLRFPTATAEQRQVTGRVFNRILTRYEKFRVDLTATADVEDRRVTLRRTFEIDLKPAFSPVAESESVEIEPGGAAVFRLLAHRTPAFEGPVTLTPTLLRGFQYPETIVIPADQQAAEIEVKAAPETPPGRYQLRMTSRGIVGKYEEEVNGPNVTITINKPAAEKKP